MNDRFIVTKKAMRPASKVPACFYCRKEIGEEHKDDCVLITKKAIVKMTVSYEVEVPAFWDKTTIEFHRNEGGWCADNALDELKELAKANGCLCQATHFECVSIGMNHYLKERS